MRTLLLVLLVGCSSYSPNLPAAPFLCGSGTPACPDGFTCQADGSSGRMVCVTPNGQIPDATNTCANDSNLEPNDMLNQAYVTPIDGVMRTMIPYTGLAICPAGDKDTYQINLAAMTSIEAVITYDMGGAALQVSILSAAGSPLANGSPVSGMDDTLRAYVNSLPSGTYYVQAYGPASGMLLTNNYSLKITTGT